MLAVERNHPIQATGWLLLPCKNQMDFRAIDERKSERLSFALILRRDPQ
ncbi:hypothetical protein RISK_006133 [Rhodopirellula islandica]|uniref:Uncharacterized protein n=1 Tax=Rhodopirellula islandica TaxID=595434 RepID=A0A0J1E8Z5_RHOIS|nr:hypothetical protein RISK_006133 [Rhodopirellula islandica]